MIDMTNQKPLFPIIDGKYQMEKEPTIRVGIILREDDRHKVSFNLNGTACKVVADGETILSAEGNESYLVEFEQDLLTLMSASGGEVLAEDHRVIRFEPVETSPEPAPKLGIKVDGIVAGRGFHWAKEIDQYLPGAIEFRLSNDRKSILLINDLFVEHYLIGVITSEMSAECPEAYMKAQAIAARSWLFAQPYSPYPDEPFDVCNDDQCQRYQGSEGWTDAAIQAIIECRAETLITKSNKYCDARYSKSTGGISEDSVHVWHTEIEGLDAMIDAPKDDPITRFFPVSNENIEEYLTGDWLAETKAFASPNVVNEAEMLKYLGRVDEAGEYFRWKVELTHADLLESLTKRAKVQHIYEVMDLEPGLRGRSGRLKSLDVVYRTAPDKNPRRHTLTSEYDIRAGLWMNFLFSSCFVIRKNHNDDGALTSVTLLGGGWGHGAGLCQIGGLGRALSGQSYDEILMAYFQNVRLEKIYT